MSLAESLNELPFTLRDGLVAHTKCIKKRKTRKNIPVNHAKNNWLFQANYYLCYLDWLNQIQPSFFLKVILSMNSDFFVCPTKVHDSNAVQTWTTPFKIHAFTII